MTVYLLRRAAIADHFRGFIRHRALEHPFHPLGQAQLEQIGLAAALRLADHPLVCPSPDRRAAAKVRIAAPADPIASIGPGAECFAACWLPA
jgi:hypothetical protein